MILLFLSGPWARLRTPRKRSGERSTFKPQSGFWPRWRMSEQARLRLETLWECNGLFMVRASKYETNLIDDPLGWSVQFAQRLILRDKVHVR